MLRRAVRILRVLFCVRLRPIAIPRNPVLLRRRCRLVIRCMRRVRVIRSLLSVIWSLIRLIIVIMVLLVRVRLIIRFRLVG